MLGDVFERFTDAARQVVVLARQEASSLGHDRLRSEHILLGLTRETDAPAAHVLQSFGVSVEDLRAQVVQSSGYGNDDRSRQIVFAPQATWIIERAQREALSLGHDEVSPQHILLALGRDSGAAAQILRSLGADPEKVRNEVFRVLGLPLILPDPADLTADELQAQIDSLTAEARQTTNKARMLRAKIDSLAGELDRRRTRDEQH